MKDRRADMLMIWLCATSVGICPLALGQVTGDLRICRLLGLQQVERAGDEVALAVGTTSWNAGQLALDWYRRPDSRHPFIAQSLYRLREGRLEQIGIAGVKHGYYVAAAPGCNGQACTGSSGQVLYKNCSDTYGPILNAGQGDMGPRYEVNPWTGAWDAASSHVQSEHDHGVLTHRLRVLDHDLDPAFNRGAQYFIEGYYVHRQNAQPATAAAWKAVTVISGAPGADWEFEIVEPSQPVSQGFAIASWQGAKVSEIAQAIPVIRGASPDGRCQLAAKVSDLGNGSWRYEYALLNIDMDRQVGSFSLAVPGGASVSEFYFSAPRQPDERLSAVGGSATDDAAWTAHRVNDAVTWSTTSNPLRWGVMYNFAFTSNRGPKEGNATLGFFRPGSPGSVVGHTTVPGL